MKLIEHAKWGRSGAAILPGACWKLPKLCECARDIVDPLALKRFRNKIFSARPTLSQVASGRHEGAKAEKAVPFPTACDRADEVLIRRTPSTT